MLLLQKVLLLPKEKVVTNHSCWRKQSLFWKPWNFIKQWVSIFDYPFQIVYFASNMNVWLYSVTFELLTEKYKWIENENENQKSEFFVLLYTIQGIWKLSLFLARTVSDFHFFYGQGVQIVDFVKNLGFTCIQQTNKMCLFLIRIFTQF